MHSRLQGPYKTAMTHEELLAYPSERARRALRSCCVDAFLAARAKILEAKSRSIQMGGQWRFECADRHSSRLTTYRFHTESASLIRSVTLASRHATVGRAERRRISRCICSSGRTLAAAPRSIASLGMPNTTQSPRPARRSGPRPGASPADRWRRRRPCRSSGCRGRSRRPPGGRPEQDVDRRRWRATRGPSFTDTA